MHQCRRFKCNIMSSRDGISTPPCKASVGHTDGNNKQANYGYHGDRGFRGSPDGCIYDEPPIARTTNSSPGPEVYRPRQPRLERPRRAPTTTTSTMSRAAPPSSDHDHVVHVNRTLGRSKWTKSFIDQLCGLWTNAGGFTMNRASPAPVDHGPLVAQ